MREIKFRGFNGEKWLYGDLTFDPKTKQATISDSRWWRHPVRFDTVGQFTGLKDSTGNEIYEGDILSLREGSDEMIKVIDFYAAINALDLSEMMNLRLLDYCLERGEVHVIGNIHDNPELIKVSYEDNTTD